MVNPVNREAIEQVKAEKRLERLFYTENGRSHKSPEELETWLRAESAKQAARERERRLKREAEEREAQLAAQKRQLAVDARIDLRTLEPAGYNEHRSVEELISAVLAGAPFAERTRLTGTQSSPLHISADLENVNLANSVFEHVQFADGCNLRNTDFRNSTFKFVSFQKGCKLSEANFDGATLSNVRFDPESEYEGARFRFADFYETNSIEFDGNYLSNATFHKGRRDGWARLSSAYSGIWQFINVALSAAFFGSLLVKLYLFEGIFRAQTLILSGEHANAIPAGGLREMTAWTFLFGDRLSSAALFGLFLVYQSLRLYVTTRVGPMIDMERNTGYTPRRLAYEHLTRLNLFVVGLGYIVLVVLALDISAILQMKILVP